jgi:hypothetical protein
MIADNPKCWGSHKLRHGEPTEAMLRAGLKAMGGYAFCMMHPEGCPLCTERLKMVWKAMLSAAS